MAKSESIHQKLSRVRKPHVHITYEVETGGAMEVKELPFVVGVCGDFSGDPTRSLKPLADRKFIEIDRDNFNDVMARMSPGLDMKVDNTIDNDGSQIAVHLEFESMDDFEPGRIVQQVEPLRKLMEVRNRLRDLGSAIDRSKGGEGLLEEILQNPDKISQLAKEVESTTDKQADTGDQS